MRAWPLSAPQTPANRAVYAALKLHADELTSSGGAELAAEIGATSADHLAAVSIDGIKSLAGSRTVATLLPGTMSFLGKMKQAPARALIDAGGSLLVIEHNLDVIKTADHIIDLGAEGGDAGGYVVGAGTRIWHFSHVSAGARWILRTFAHYVKDGLIPNLFPEGQSQGLYHTADATLWFFHAADRYVRRTGDRERVWEDVFSERFLIKRPLLQALEPDTAGAPDLLIE